MFFGTGNLSFGKLRAFFCRYSYMEAWEKFHMKKFFCLLLFLTALLVHIHAKSGVEFGIGSGYVFYGGSETRDRLSQLSSPGQIVLNACAGYHLSLAEPVRLYAGVESACDFRWSGGDHIYLIDYAGVLGFQIYPGLAGLMLTVDYVLGHRSDWYNVGDTKRWYNTDWGNGFKIAIQYDFMHNITSFGPVVGASWRRMPRGDGADNILSVFLKLTIN